MTRALLSMAFGAGVSLRNAAYDRGLFRVHPVSVPVISVGNISVGGTGKTPLVHHIAGHLLQRHGVAVVTRGYRRMTKGTFIVSDGRGAIADVASSGDEPVMVARRLPPLVVVADEQRARGCHLAIERFGAERIILDDGFQHRSCERDVDIVVVDASRDLTGERLLPAGRLREPVRNLSRAAIVVLSRCGDADSCAGVLRTVRRYTDAAVFRTVYAVAGNRRIGSHETLPTNALSGMPLVTCCGIGSPEAFRQTVGGLGFTSMHHETFPDHHAYNRDDVRRLIRLADTHAAEAFLTTEKDAVRLESILPEFGGRAVYYLEMRIEFLDNEHDFFAMINQRTAYG